MKQVAQNYKTGELTVLDAPVPACRPGGVLVRSWHSLISTGTEVMKVSEASMSLVGKARARPDQVRKVLDSVAQQGVRAAYAKAMNRLDSYTPLGYSLCGVVIECGDGVEGLRTGQAVACAGNEYALHAEVNWVPRNLCVPVPDGVDPRLAAFATVGAIAMHGVRRSEPQLGDTACVVGLGLVGQLVVQLLVAGGVRVVGLDVRRERCHLAEKAGALACGTPDDMEGLERVLLEVSGGLGADHVLLVAGGSSNGPVEAAARLARDRARIVDVGKLKLDLPWNAYYEKELDVRFSRSYGPGRYDDRYEVEGIDYPAGYVRWTERRNLECFLDLLARGALPVELLVSGSFPIAEAPEVYTGLRSGDLDGIGYLFDYPGAGESHSGPDATPPAAPRPVRQARTGQVALAFLGAGNYASSMLLPHLVKRGDVSLARVATNTSLSAANAQRRFGFADASTNVDAVLGDPSIDAVFVVTRHHSHADLVCRALEAGKATFVEKPLALGEDELQRILEVVRTTGNDRLMVGFNRRFAPLLVDLRHRFGPTSGAAVLHYRVNAGPLDPSSWYADAAREGSRFTGEGGHFLDTAGWWLDARPEEVFAFSAGGDSLHACVRFDDRSVATVDYLANGNPRCPKEAIEVSADGRTVRIDNFRRADLWTGRRRHTVRARGPIDKGQQVQLAQFLEAVKSGGPMPVSLPSLVATTRATLAVQRSLEEGGAVRVAP